MLGLNLRNRFVPARDSTNLGARRTRPRDTPTPPTTPTIENENPLVEASQEESWLFRSCSQSENTDNRIALFTPPIPTNPRNGTQPHPQCTHKPEGRCRAQSQPHPRSPTPSYASTSLPFLPSSPSFLPPPTRVPTHTHGYG